LKKKNQKRLSALRGGSLRIGLSSHANGHKFFGSFFQKRASFLAF
jgi:hypothetical protein